MPRSDRDAGFTFAEALLALLLRMLIITAVLALANSAQTMASTQVDATEMHERARIAADVLFNDLMAAGAGLDAGPMSGPLVGYLPPLLPRRLGRASPDASNVARADAITIIDVPATSFQTSLHAALPVPTADLIPEAWPNCPLAKPLCGLAAGMTLLVFDPLGHFDLFGVASVGTAGRLELRGRDQSAPYQIGATLSEAEIKIYSFDAASGQLRVYDGSDTDVPVADNIVGLTFEYFGDPAPPVAPRPPAGIENCLYDATGAPRPMVTLSAPGGSLAPLPLAMLSDGPWCGAGTNQFDVDVLRIRRIRVTLRVQAAPPAARASGQAFAKPGTSHASIRQVPDDVITFDVAPRNLSLGR